MISLDFFTHRNRLVKSLNFEIELSKRRFLYSESLDFGSQYGQVEVRALGQASELFGRITNNTCVPQLAALLFGQTHNPRALDWYFPITNTLGPLECGQFDSLREYIAKHPNFDLHLVGESRTVISSLMPIEVHHLVAGHLAEIFFYRLPLLQRFLSQPRHFLLYTTVAAYQNDGGQAGGQYHSERETLQLVLARLFEGFGGDAPGVCPFLHEFGHMLDFFNAGSGRMSKDSSGFLPGLRPGDGALYAAAARQLFLYGKKIERDRYVARYLGQAAPNDPPPIGHPYVFQNDSEFIAGYFEMFYRNPHYFASLNPHLFNAFIELFGWDTRRAWVEDFPFYVESNRQFYFSGEQPGQSGITVPNI